MNKQDYNNKIIDDAVSILNDDGIIVVPTDTVYGLAVRSDSEVAINKVFEVKKRDFSKKLPYIVDTYKRLKELCEITDDVLKRIQPFFPGKLTVVLKKKNSDDTIAVRMIDNEIINRIIDKIDCPLLLTSANISDEEVSDDIMKIVDIFDGKIDMIIMGNKVGKVSSTIVDLSEGDIKLIREGSISFDKIRKYYYEEIV